MKLFTRCIGYSFDYQVAFIENAFEHGGTKIVVYEALNNGVVIHETTTRPYVDIPVEATEPSGL